MPQYSEENMPFLDSSIIRPLYDVHEGGRPKGYHCELCHLMDDGSCNTPCHRVTRTLAGMRTHQRIVHGIKQQQEFNFEPISSAADPNS
jgi:hypothetical protein